MENKTLKERFINYLISAGYKQYTPKGLPSTVYDHANRIDTVIYCEKYSDWNQIVENISKLCKQYDIGGEKQYLGAKSNRAIISALKRFKEFLSSSK